MSDALYLTRLRWHNGSGVVKTGGNTIALTIKPVLGFAFHSIDYSPGVCEQLQVEPWEASRELLPAEREACAHYVEDILAPPDVEV